MSIFEKTRHCTKRLPCRFKLVMIAFSMAVVITVVAVPVVSGLA
jgi:hypothetical protein